jgi:hypothetical protein
MKTIVLVAPTVEPITLLEAKAQLRIESAFTEDDDYINALISVSRDRCENYCNQFFTVQSIKMLFEGALPVIGTFPFPGLTVTSITYTDKDNVLQTLAPADYIVDAVNQTITFTQGYDSINYQVLATTTVPVQVVGVQQGIKLMITDMYELRSETVVGVSITENPAVKAILYPYRLSLGL